LFQHSAGFEAGWFDYYSEWNFLWIRSDLCCWLVRFIDFVEMMGWSIHCYLYSSSLAWPSKVVGFDIDSTLDKFLDSIDNFVATEISSNLKP